MRRTLIAGTAVVAALALAGLTQAGVFDSGPFHEEFSNVDSNYCGSGLTVRSDLVADGRFMFKQQGRNGLFYYLENTRLTRTDTNLSNGKFVVDEETVMTKDQTVTDNHDGTVTVVDLATGNAVLRDMNGKVIARNPGQVRFVLIIDENGTPTDPTDDQVIDSLGLIKGSTGRSDDFCAAAVAALS